jgi:NTP pyrophosphatase (non-canonical NTP hydrolase)
MEYVLQQHKISEALNAIESEYYRAKSKHPGEFHNLHEGYAVLLEEVDELWDEIKKKHPDMANLKVEAIQVAAMALRIITELCNKE